MTALTPIPIASEHLQAQLLPRGATLSALHFGAEGANLLLGFARPADHFDIPGCVGALVGPVANRLRDGAVRIGGARYQMPRNENGMTTLHSGPEGLHVLDWTVTAHHPDALHLALNLPDGAQGLPGRRRIEVAYRLHGFCLSIEITATTDRTTLMNVAAHPYWTLGQNGDVSALRLGVVADTYLPVDGRNLPTGERRAVAGSAFDFRSPAPVPLSAGLDVNFCLAPRNRAEPRPAATLEAADGTRLEIETTAPGLQVYAGAHLPEVRGVLTDGGDLYPYRGLAIEPQYWPDAPNHPEFPQITLQPGETWQQLSRYKLTPPR